MRAELSRHGFSLNEYTRAMGMSLRDVPPTLEDLDPAPPDWAEYVRFVERFGAPAGVLAEADPAAVHLLRARVTGSVAATAFAFDHDRDCGVFNVSTVEAMRRRGLGTALTARLAATPPTAAATPQACSPPPWPRRSRRRRLRDLGRRLEFGPWPWARA